MKKTICLNMIVKNERHVIHRCLSSIKPLLDYWVIVDTGSTDGTQQAIRDYLHDIPGELHERPWVDFAYNRNEALDLARGKADYFLFIDADDRLVFSESFSLPDLELDCYNIPQYYTKTSDLHNIVVFLIKDLPEIHWKEALHEYLAIPETSTSCTLEGVYNEYFHDGARGQNPKTAENDIAILEEMHRQDPLNGRTLVLLASYLKKQCKYAQALSYYEKRSNLEGRKDEIYHALSNISDLQKLLRSSFEVRSKSCCRAFLFFPLYVDPLFELCNDCMETENHFLGYLIAQYALSLPLSPEHPYFHSAVPDWGMLLHFYQFSLQLSEHKNAYKSARKLLANPHLPHHYRTTIAYNQAPLQNLLANENQLQRHRTVE